MMKLYGALASPYVARVVLVARYKGLELPLEMPAGGLKSPDYLAINPLGRMPTLEHGNRHVIESEVICEYLEELHPTPTILPGDAYARAQARVIGRMADLYIGPEASALFRQMNPATRDEDAVEAAKTKLAGSLGILDRMLSDGPWAAGEFSLADCMLLPTVLVMQKTVVPVLGVQDPASAGPRLTAWWRQVNTEPLTASLVPEYGAAVDAFLARMRGG